MKKRQRFKAEILYCGLTREAFHQISPLIIQRNRYMLQFTSDLMTLFAALLLIVRLIIAKGHDAACIPYTFLLGGGLLSITLRKAFHLDNDRFTLSFCYFQVILVLLYATILGASPQNVDDPSASFVVFLAVMPLTVNDRPVRMFSVMTAASILYLIASSQFKTSHAFSLDIFNVASFAVIGMILYVVVSNRNVQEIHVSEREHKLQENIIMNMATVIEERDESTGNHIQGTVDFVRGIVDGMKHQPVYNGLSTEYTNNIVRAAPLHDVGKIRIPDSILKKPGRLTPEEFEIMKKHTVYGGEIIGKTMEQLGDNAYYEVAHNIALYHHERYDGTGYPSGLKGESIPLEARVMALADVYEALISERVYKKAYPKEKAVAIILGGRGTQFDPTLTDLFLEYLES